MKTLLILMMALSMIASTTTYAQTQESTKEKSTLDYIATVFNGAVLKIRANRLSNFSEGLAAVQMRGKKGIEGFVNENYKMVIKPQFKYADNFSEGLAAVTFDYNNYGYINKHAEMIIEPQFSYAGSFDAGAALVRSGEQTGVINKQGEWVIEPQLYTTSFSEGLAPVEINGKWGYYSDYYWGRWRIKPQFDHALPFLDGVAQVTLNGEVLKINKQGEVVNED